MDGRPLQDVRKVQCYGCGALNAHGMQIRHGKELVQTWVRVHDPARDPQSSYAFFNFDPESVKIDSSNGR